MIVFPNAKINLGLDILRKRPDGYHDIATVMAGVDWCDVLEVVPSGGTVDSLAVTGRPVDCPPGKNLVMKALRAMRNRVHVPAVDIFLHKVIPDGAGLGGGSSDAAFAVLAINKLFNIGMDSGAMASVLAEVGSDCPYFVYNRPMLCTGRGEVMTPVSAEVSERLRNLVPVIVKYDDCYVSTAAAYSGVTPRERNATPDATLLLPVETWRDNLTNDFEDSVFSAESRPAAVKARLYDLGAVYASMTGSGSAVYGLFNHDVANVVDFASEFAGACVHKGHFVLD